MLPRVYSRAFRATTTSRPAYVHALGRRTLVDISNQRQDYEAKYAEKLQQRAKSEGLSIDELKKKIAEKAKEKLMSIKPQPKSESVHAVGKHVEPRTRNDSSPIKPLADIMDLRKVLAKDHTRDEISGLWNGYHATRSKGTGRGYLSAAIPLDTYQRMANKATKCSSFVLPLQRPVPETEKEVAHEFFFVQWDFYVPPPHPSETPGLPFEEPLPKRPASAAPNPPYSTILFTTLQEYKLRQSFALPYLVLTNYTDLATTHGVVLMRGELTASPTSPDNYLLSQGDAQMLAMSMQRFYLADESDPSTSGRARLLRAFHERPEEFKWEDLLAFADPSV